MVDSNSSSSEDSDSDSPAALGQASSAAAGEPTPKPRKRRRAITDAQRWDVRGHKRALVQENGKWTIHQMIDFFREKYDRVLSHSTISSILSDKYKYLDEEEHPLNPDFKKKRTSYWPDVDAALFDWEQQMLKKKTHVTNEALKTMAKRIFSELPQYHDVEPPKFSDGWLAGYRARYEVKTLLRLDRSGVPNRVVVGKEMEDIRQELSGYKSGDIYSMDETALFWKMSPDSNTSTNTEKALITVCLACNVNGTRKLPLWIVGKAKTPRCFDRSGIHMGNFPIVWQNNGKALMTGVMFEEYLRWFDDQMAGREVCLLLDELCAHESGVIFLRAITPEGLNNTKILFLPTSSTFVCQPLDQGVIRSWKAHYRKRWVTYMCNEYDAGRDPMKSMNVLQAIRWAIAAWEEDVTSTCIRDSWIKSRVLGPKYTPGISGWNNMVNDETKTLNDTITQIEQQIKALKQENHINSVMKVATFVNPVNEVVDDNDDDLADSLVEIYSSGGVQRDHETDEEDVAVAPIEESEALELLSRLLLYEEQQKRGDMAVIASLNNYEREIQARAKQ